MQVQKKQPVIEAELFDGTNYDELKQFCPKLIKYTFREEYPYTVGWPVPEAGEDGFTEALPGFYIVKENGEYRILEPHVFEQLYQ